MGSADWMGRNLDRRVETVVPVLDAGLREYIDRDIMDILAEDNCKSRWVRSDGTYVRRLPADGEPVRCAQSFMLEAAQAL